MDTRSITELASIVASNTEKYNDYLLDEGLPLPSHNTSSSLAQGPPPPLPDHVETALVEATEASYALHQLLVGPVGRVYGAAVEVSPQNHPNIRKCDCLANHTYSPTR